MPVAAAARRPVSQSVSCFRPQSRRHRTRRDDAPRDGASPSEQRQTRWAAGPAPGTHVARARGSRQNPASSSVAKLFECRAKRWQSPPVEPYTSANGLCLAATPRVTAGALPARFDAGPGPRRCGGEILTFPDILTTQGLSLWSLNIVRWRTRYTGSCATRP